MATETASPRPDHEAILRWLFEDVWSRGRFERIPVHLARGLTFHFRGQTTTLAPQDLARIVTAWRSAFPDLSYDIAGIVLDGDLAAVRLTRRGTHLGTWRGLGPTGRTVEVDEAMFFRFAEGRIAEVWEVTDELAQRRQLGLIDG